MQISSNNSLPVFAGQHPQTPPRRLVTPARPDVVQENPASLVNQGDSDQANRRPPLFVQPAQHGKLSRNGEQALRAYHDTALAGAPAELVNRVDVLV